MKLLLKFNLMFVLVFGMGLIATGYAARQFLRNNARERVLQEARLMMETTASTRTYTSKQIKPLLAPREKQENTFFPQTVPAYSAGQIFGYLHGKFPDYTYKEATLNPTNLADRATDWETDVVETFRNDRNRQELVGERDTPTGRTLFLAKPMKATPPCLECHSVPAAAPPAMIRTYGSNNGFGWKVDEIIAAQIVTVPMSVPTQIADKAFADLLMWLAAISIISLILLNLALVITVIQPVSRMAAAADAISKGNLEIVEVPVKGKDEIAVLADSFNRLTRSLSKAMKMLEE